MPGSDVPQFVSQETLQQMLDAQTRKISKDLKLHFNEQLAASFEPMNKEIAAIKSKQRWKQLIVV